MIIAGDLIYDDDITDAFLEFISQTLAVDHKVQFLVRKDDFKKVIHKKFLMIVFLKGFEREQGEKEEKLGYVNQNGNYKHKLSFVNDFKFESSRKTWRNLSNQKGLTRT